MEGEPDVTPEGEDPEPKLDDVRARVEELRIFASAESRRRFLVHAVLLVAAFVLVAVLVRRELTLLTDAERLRRFVGTFGILGPIVLIALQALQVVVAPVPAQVLAVVAGYLYGTWLGTLYSMLGIVLGSTAAFWLSRRYGRTYVESVLHEDAVARFDAIDDDHARVALLVLFLVPGLPDDAICFAGGLTRLPLWQLVVLAVVGRTPSFFLVNAVGDLAGTGQFEAALVLTAVIGVVSAVCLYYRHWFMRRVGLG